VPKNNLSHVKSYHATSFGQMIFPKYIMLVWIFGEFSIARRLRQKQGR